MKAQTILIHKTLYAAAVFLKVDRYDFKPFCVESLVQLFHGGHLEATGAAPCGPEVQEHHLPSEIAQATCRSSQILKLEINDFGSLFERLKANTEELVGGNSGSRGCEG